MQVKKSTPSSTEVTLHITADPAELTKLKNHTLKHLAAKVNLPGFRAGKAPLALIEKQADPTQLQTEFLDEALNYLYVNAIRQEQIRPVAQPTVDIKKFVPFDTLEIDVKIEVVGEVKLGDYKKIKKTVEPVKVLASDIDEVIRSLRIRMAERKDVERAAKEGDQVWIDFEGVDAKTGEPIQGADGKEYPLVIGSDTFIKGFEPEMIGLSAGDEKTFTVTFPKDYNVTALQSRKVTFSVKVLRVQEVIEPKVDDEFAAKVGPFKSLKDLKDDIKLQIEAERKNEQRRKIENEIVEEIVEKSHVELPSSLLESQMERAREEERRNLNSRGITWPDHLAEEGMSEEEHNAQRIRPEAEKRLRSGLVLSALAEAENLDVTPEELRERIALYKQQYKSDAQMQAELDKPENQQDIAARILTEKTIAALYDRATSSKK